MLKTIKKIFARSADAPLQHDKELEPAPRKAGPNFVTDPFRINTILKKLENNAQLCTITFSDQGEKFTSSILAVHPKRQEILLDELVPAHGNTLLEQKKGCKLSAYLEGIHLAFTLEDLTPVTHQGEKHYKTALPQRIYYPQRRKSPRVPIQSLRIAFAGISSINNATVGGQLYDLSRTGIGVNLSDNHARIKRGDQLIRCHIRLDEYRIDFDLHVRFVKKAPQNKINLGGFFENLSSRDQKRLSAFVAQLERQYIRQTKNN